MVVGEVSDYIRKNLKQGYSKAKIKEALDKAGYDNVEVDKAFGEVDNQSHTSPNKNHISPKLLKIVGITLVILLIAFLMPWSRLFAAEPEPFESFYILDLRLCENVSTEEMGVCIETNKVLISNPQTCENIIEDQDEGPDIGLICTSLANNDISYCDKGNDDTIMFCKILHIMRANDISLCQDLADVVSAHQFCEYVVNNREPGFGVQGYDFIFE